MVDRKMAEDLARRGFRRASDIISRPTTYLIKNMIPDDGLTVSQGDPGVGKSTAHIEWIARATRGQPLLPDTIARDPINCVWITGEESAERAIRPKLEAAGADLDRVFIYDLHATAAFSLTDRNALQAIIEATRASWLIVDGFFGFTGNVDIYKDNALRAVLQPLASLAEENRCTITLIRHNQKKRGMRATAGGIGGIGITGVARSVLVFGKPDPEEPERFAVAVNKNSAGPLGVSYGYGLSTRIVEAKFGPIETMGIDWSSRLPGLKDDDLYSEHVPKAPSKGDEADEFLLRTLSEPAKWPAVLKLGAEEGHSKATLRRSRDRLKADGVIVQLGGGPTSKWALAGESDPSCSSSPSEER